MDELISKNAAIDALKNDMASLDHIIKGMSANDVRLDVYVSQRNQVNYDIYTINNLPTAQPEIVRCKDCRYYNSEEKECLDLLGHGRRWEDDDFCSYAERRGATT